MKIEDLKYYVLGEPVNEKNFDIEKWRKENSIDYFKYLYMIEQQQGKAKDTVFREIYRDVRWHLPDILYKYYSLTNNRRKNEIKFETLRKKQLYLSDIQSFNDPFDTRAYYYNPELLKSFPWLQHCGGRLIDDFSAYLKAASFTSNGVQSMPMRAHYANNHAGFCVSYDMENQENLPLSSCVFPIQYTDQRLDVTSLMIQQAQIIISDYNSQPEHEKKNFLIKDWSLVYMSILLSNIKHSSWSYEREFRCTMHANVPGMPYINAKPHAIYVGMKCSECNLMQLKQIAEAQKIPIYKMCFNELSSSYELQIQNIS